MAKQNITKKYTFAASGILGIEDDDMTIEIEDRGEFSLKKALSDFDGRPVKISCSYDEDYEDTSDNIDIDEETGEVL